jgi:large subunit ribosomal protein L13
MASFNRRSAFKGFHKGAISPRGTHLPEGLPEAQYTSRRDISRENERWWILDAKGLQVRETAKIAAHYVSGLHKPDFTPNLLTPDQVVVINIKDTVMVGDTWVRYPISWETTFSGGRYRVRACDMYERDPCMLLFNFIREELAFNRTHKTLSVSSRRGFMQTRNLLEFCWLYEDAVHPHYEQSPTPILWHATTKPHYYTNKFMQPRWKINQFTQ